MKYIYILLVLSLIILTSCKNKIKIQVDDKTEIIQKDIDSKFEDVKLNSDSAYFNRGVSKFELNDYKGAISDYTKALELNPNNSRAYMNRGVMKTNLKDYDGAIADYTKAIELEPSFALNYVNRAEAKENLWDYDSACEDWKKAAKLGDENASKWVAKHCN